MSAQDLADACKKLELSFSRSALANFESGRRPTISVAELLVLAKALAVPPAELVFPVGRLDEVEVLPGQVLPPWEALEWFAGEEPFATRDAADGKLYAEGNEEFQESATKAFREHRSYVQQCLDAANAVTAARKAATTAASDRERDAHLAHAAAEEVNYRMCRDLLRHRRTDMRKRSITPPELAGVLADVDGEG